MLDIQRKFLREQISDMESANAHPRSYHYSGSRRQKQHGTREGDPTGKTNQDYVGTQSGIASTGATYASSDIAATKSELARLESIDFNATKVIKFNDYYKYEEDIQVFAGTAKRYVTLVWGEDELSFEFSMPLAMLGSWSRIGKIPPGLKAKTFSQHTSLATAKELLMRNFKNKHEKAVRDRLAKLAEKRVARVWAKKPNDRWSDKDWQLERKWRLAWFRDPAGLTKGELLWTSAPPDGWIRVIGWTRDACLP